MAHQLGILSGTALQDAIDDRLQLCIQGLWRVARCKGDGAIQASSFRASAFPSIKSMIWKITNDGLLVLPIHLVLKRRSTSERKADRLVELADIVVHLGGEQCCIRRFV